jgi:VWFA-related protein
VKGWWVLLLSAIVWGQDDPPVFRTTSALVLLDVQVIHAKTNAAAGDLHAQDFELSEDGAPQKITFFGRDQLPLSVVLLFDLTESVHGVLHELAKGARAALDRLKPEDEVAVMVYAAGAQSVDGFTRDHARTAAAIAKAARMKSEDAAFFNEAVYQAAAELQRSANPSSRRVILWFTDNLPNFPTKENLQTHDEGLDGEMPHSEPEGMRALHESGTVVMPLLLKDYFYFWGARVFEHEEIDFRHENPRLRNYSAGDAHKYAELTGGFAMEMRGKKVEDRLADAIDNLRGRYTIGYRPAEEKPAGVFCKVKVGLAPEAPLRPKEWKVLARAGYYRR